MSDLILTETATYDKSIVIRDNGTSFDQSAQASLVQALANRTAYLLSLLKNTPYFTYQEDTQDTGTNLVTVFDGATIPPAYHQIGPDSNKLNGYVKTFKYTLPTQSYGWGTDRFEVDFFVPYYLDGATPLIMSWGWLSCDCAGAHVEVSISHASTVNLDPAAVRGPKGVQIRVVGKLKNVPWAIDSGPYTANDFVFTFGLFPTHTVDSLGALTISKPIFSIRILPGA